MPRTFLAIDPADDVRDRLVEFIGRCETSTSGVRWAATQTLHVTLKFYGDVDAGGLDRLVDELGCALSGSEFFEIEHRGIGAFPHQRRPTTLWTGVVDETPLLETLNAEIEKTSSKLGYAAETRPFRPHLTIGRVRRGTHPRGLDAVFADFAGQEFGRTRVEAVTLYASELTSRGPIYTVLTSIPLSPGNHR